MRPSPAVLALIAIACFAAALAVSVLAHRWLVRRRVLDRPNDRSSHVTPVPRGGGIGFMAVILLALAIVAAVDGTVPASVLIGIALVVAVSFADDLRGLPFPARLAVQIAAVALVVATMPGDAPILAATLPVWLDRLLVGLAWLWFINLFNFMDGIDGIAAGEAMAIGIGLLVLAFAEPLLGEGGAPAVAVASAAAGFLVVNWHPARLFMGDAGSAGLGFVLGWLLIETAAAGFLGAAFILPIFFVVDASSTLLMRLLRRRPLATPHRDHAYQAGVDRGLGQPVVSGTAIAFGLAMIGVAFWSLTMPVPAFVVALLSSAALIAWLRFGGRNP